MPNLDVSQHSTNKMAEQTQTVTDISNDASLNLMPYVLDITDRFPMQYAVPIFGYCFPALSCVTLVTNILIVMVLLKKHMRSPTNSILAGIALSDILTMLFPLPVFLYFLAFGHYKEYVPYRWCYFYELTSVLIPKIFHTASIWLTMALAVQRYIYICHNFRARKWPCTVTKVFYGILSTYAISILIEISRFVDFRFTPIEVTSRMDPNKTIVACTSMFKDWVLEHIDVYFNVYYWFRIVTVHFIPCTVLVVLNALLISAIRSGERQRIQMLNQTKGDERKKLRDSIAITRMLVVVVSLFLAIELPIGIVMTLQVFQNTLEMEIFSKASYGVMDMVFNFCIALSSPLNLCIYCGMSKQFRRTLKRMFIWTRVSVD